MHSNAHARRSLFLTIHSGTPGAPTYSVAIIDKQFLKFTGPGVSCTSQYGNFTAKIRAAPLAFKGAWPACTSLLRVDCESSLNRKDIVFEPYFGVYILRSSLESFP